MKRAPTVAALVLSYLVVAGVALLVWFGWPAQPLPTHALALCAAPVMLQLAIVAGARRDPRRLILRSFAWALFAPVLLLMWGASSELATPAPSATQGAALPLDSRALAAGAVASQQVPMQHPELRELWAHAFADGSELRLMRFTDTGAAAHYLEFVRATLAGSDVTLGARRGVRARAAGAEGFVYWEQHGRALLELRAADQSQALARLHAQGVPPPVDSSFSAPPAPPRPVWPFALGYSLAHALAICAFLLWAGAATTRVDATAGARPVPVAELLARLDALERLGAPCVVLPGDGELERVIDLNQKPDSQRAHRLTLSVDAARAEVRVREFEGAYGAAPRDAAEADMRALGEIGIHPTRPRARKVWAGKVQTTIIDPARLAQVPWLGEDGALRPTLMQALDADGMIHLICALVTRSGFAWQPVFFGARRRS